MHQSANLFVLQPPKRNFFYKIDTLRIPRLLDLFVEQHVGAGPKDFGGWYFLDIQIGSVEPLFVLPVCTHASVGDEMSRGGIPQVHNHSFEEVDVLVRVQAGRENKTFLFYRTITDLGRHIYLKE